MSAADTAWRSTRSWTGSSGWWGARSSAGTWSTSREHGGTGTWTPSSRAATWVTSRAPNSNGDSRANGNGSGTSDGGGEDGLSTLGRGGGQRAHPRLQRGGESRAVAGKAHGRPPGARENLRDSRRGRRLDRRHPDAAAGTPPADPPPCRHRLPAAIR